MIDVSSRSGVALSGAQVRRSALAMGGLVALLWAIEVADVLSGGALNPWGLSPRDVGELPQIFTAPLLHHGWGHLIANTPPFFVLGFAILLSGTARWAVATLASVVGSGLLVWLIAWPGTVTLGASGLVFGWLAYLLTRGLFSREPRQILLAAVLLLVYGGVLWGLLPSDAAVSWQAHVGGALGGIGAAWFLHSTSDRRRRLDGAA